MALITDYATLSTAVGDYLARSDLTTYIPNFIQNGENKIYRDPRLRLRAMEEALSVPVTSGVAAVPSDYLELKYANYVTTPIVSLERTTPEYIYARYTIRSGAEIPKYIAREGDNFIFGPYPANGTITGIYYKRLTSLSSGNTTNWFTSYAPELLLYAALLDSSPFLRDDDRIGTWANLYEDTVRTITQAERNERWSGSNLAVKPG